MPFFAKPYVALPGIAVLRYQARAAVVETEVRWNVTRRWGVLGFIGAGKATANACSWSEAETPVAKGAGVRDLIARKLGLYAGVDVARGPEKRAFYIQVGAAWY